MSYCRICYKDMMYTIGVLCMKCADKLAGKNCWNCGRKFSPMHQAHYIGRGLRGYCETCADILLLEMEAACEEE